MGRVAAAREEPFEGWAVNLMFVVCDGSGGEHGRKIQKVGRDHALAHGLQ